MRRWLFNFAYLFVACVIWPWFLFKALTTGKYRAGLLQRLGRIPKRAGDKPAIWVHAVSVGELLQVRPLLSALKEKHPDHDVVVTYTTRTAAEIAAKELHDYYHCYSPIDLSWVVAKFFRRLRPALIVLVELELWPNWLMHAGRKGVPVVLINGRISEGSFRNYRRFARLLRPAYDGITMWAMQDETYAERARVLARQDAAVTVAGNLKYDSLKAEADPDKAAMFRELFSLGDRPVLVCGSTHPGEHDAIIEMLPRLDCRCVIVPRHPERYAAVREALTKAGLKWVDRSELTPDNSADEDAVVILDTMGELAHVYGIADVVFVGGSLVPHGGQNMAEPVALGKTTLFGPHTHNFKATVRELKEAQGAIEVQDANELERELNRLLKDEQTRDALGKAGQTRLLASRGALQRYLELIERLIHGTPAAETET